MNADYITPDYFDMCAKTVRIPTRDVPSGADSIIPVEGDGMEPFFHDGQHVFLQQCSSLLPYDPGAFIVDGKLYLRLYTEQDGKAILTTYENHREPIEIGPETDFHIIGRVLRQ